MTTANNGTQQDISKKFKDQIKGQVTCRSSGDLMTNFIAGSAIDAKNEIDVIQDSNGDPILFSISTPISSEDGTNVQQLFMTYRDESIGTGWKQIDISPSKDSTMNVFGVSQDPISGEFVLAVAVMNSDGSGETTVYITDSISHDTSQTDWSDAASLWTPRNGTPDGAIVQKLLIGENTNVSDAPLIIANVQIDNNASHYFIQGDTSKDDFKDVNSASNSAWQEYQMPEGATEILDLAVGTMYLNNDYHLGTYALYNVGSDLRLMFTSVPTQTNSLGYDLQLDPPAGSFAIQTLPDKNDADISMLFVAGNGLYIYESADQITASTNKVPAEPTLISNDPAFSNISQLGARQDSSHISVWVRNKDQVLFYVRGTQDVSARDWTLPLQMRKNVSRIAAIRNQEKDANAVIVAGSDGQSVSYMWQDSATTLWKQSDMPLPTLDSVQDFSCYTTVLSFTDENDNPVIGQDVHINASEWTYATVNGYYKSLDNDTSKPVTIKTDSQGKVTIINKVENASTPAFWAKADFIDNQHTAHPASNILDEFSSISNAQDLLDAKTQDGDDVITGDLRSDTDTLESVAQGIQQIMGTVNELPPDGTQYTASSGGGASLVADDSAGHIWGMSFNKGSAKYHSGDDAQQLFQKLNVGGSADGFASAEESDSFAIGDNIEAAFAWAGDALQSMWSDIEGVTKFIVDTTKKVVDGVANVIIEIGGKVVSFVVKTISDVLSFVGWLLETIEVGIKKLIKWIGFLFEWDDILTTHNVFRNMSNQTLAYFGSVMENAEQPITDLFNNLIDKVNEMPAFQITSEQDANLMTAMSGQSQNLSDQGQSDLSDIQNNSGFNFAAYQTEHGGTTAPAQFVAAGESPTTVDLTDNDLFDQFKQVLQDILDTLKDGFKSFEQVFIDIGSLMNDDKLTIGNLLKVVSKDVIVSILTFARDLFITFIDLADLLIELIISMLNSKINIPFVSGLYSWVTKGDDFTLMDSFALLGAIPTTIGYKILKGEAPFKNGTGGLDTMSYEQIFPNQMFPNLAQLESNEQSFMAFAPTSDAIETDSLVDSDDIKMVYSLAGGAMGTISGVLSFASTYVEYGVADEAKKGQEKWVSALFCVDLLFSTLSVASTFPIREGDSGRDLAENILDYPVWLTEAIELLIKGFVPALKVSHMINRDRKLAAGEEIEEALENEIQESLKKLEEDVIAPVEGLYQAIAGLVGTGFNFASLFVETVDNDDFDGWDSAKIMQSFCSSMGMTTSGIAGLAMISSEETDDPYELIATGLIFVISVFLNAGSTGICAVRVVHSGINDAEEIFEYR